MSKKILIVLLSIASAICLCIGISACETDKHTHNLNHVSEVAATCTTDGNIDYWFCDGCGKYYSDEYGTNEITTTVITSKTGHSFTNYVSDGNATCTEDGTQTAACDHDGCSVTDTITDEGSKLGHSFTNYVSDGNATCTEDGTQTAACDHDGCSVTDMITDEDSKLGHSFTNYVSDGNATCTEDGTQTAACDHDGCSVTDTITDEGSKLGHTLIKTNAVAETCTKDGNIDYWYCSTCKQYYSDENAVTEIKLSETVLEAKGHDYVVSWTWTGTTSAEATFTCENDGTHTQTLSATITNAVTTEATCTTAGVRTYTATVTFEGKTYTAKQNEAIAAAGHVWDNGTITTAPTCTEDGVKTFTCTVCHNSYPETIKATGHDYVFSYWTWTDYKSAVATFVCENDDTHTYDVEATITSEVTTAPTCITTGIKTYTATATFENNIYTATKTEVLDYSGHVIEHKAYTAATCTEEGNKEYWYCSVCHAVYSDDAGENEISSSDVIISATGHTATSYVTYNDTYHYYYCDVCNAYVEEIHTIGSDLKCTLCEYSTSYSNYLEFTAAADLLNYGDYGYVLTGIGECTDTSIIIPSTYSGEPVIAIGTYAFSCSRSSEIVSVTIPDSITRIENGAFSGCGLTSITIPDSVTNIAENTFEGCYYLESIYIGKGLTSLIGTVFGNCTSLTSITIDSENTYLKAVNNVVYSYDGKQVIYYPMALNNTSYTVLDGVTEVAAYAFYSNTTIKLRKITLPDTVTHIYRCAFADIPITSIDVGSGLTYIAECAFMGCSYLTSINIPDSVTYIGINAFDGCYSLQNITIPSKLTSINDYTFYGCSSLTSITIPENVTSIGTGAFDGCSMIESIVIGNNVTSLGASAFSGCTALKTVTIGNSVESIGSNTFESCYSLTSITIGSSVSKIGSYAFYNCKLLTIIVLPENVSTIEESAFFGCTGLTSIVIPDNVTTIGMQALYGCTALESITIGSNVTSFGIRAFYNCTSLTTVYYNGTVTEWEGITIYSNNDCLTSADIYYYSDSEPDYSDGYNYWHYVEGEIVVWTKAE